ncbi:MAG: aminodeoxychorismate/anthranilate synthase component II [Acidobacteriota bacterium]
MKKVFLLDNYDSFTYNVAQLLGKIGCNFLVRRPHETSLQEMESFFYSSDHLALHAHDSEMRIILSPGPMRPEDHPFLFEVLERFHGSARILGICLGMQAINKFFGGSIKKDDVPLHGKVSMIIHSGRGLFHGIKNPFQAARYHSLLLDMIPDPLKVTAITDDGKPMAFQHRIYPIFGVQFHPESFMTEHGEILLANFMNAGAE